MTLNNLRCEAYTLANRVCKHNYKFIYGNKCLCTMHANMQLKKYIILFLLKEKCKECENTLKQIGDQNRYYCDSSPTICSMSGKTHNI